MPVRHRLTAAALLALAACAPAPPPAAAPAADAGPELVSTLSVQTAGDTVWLSLQVTNAAAGPVTLVFPSGQSYDFSVRRGGETLWTWSADKQFMQAVREETLAAGATRAFREPWVPGPGVRGELTARGWLTATSHAAERSTGFRLP